jgi:hypothetical protein
MTFTAEDQLLLICSRSRLEQQHIAQAERLLRTPLDWDYLLEVSIRHAVAPLVSAALEGIVEQCPEVSRCVPSLPRSELRSLYRGSARRNERLFRVLGDIVGALDRVGAPSVGLKDAQLATEVYPDRALRPMGDVDLLIRHEDYHRVDQAMRSLGFAAHPREEAPFVLRYGSGRQFRRVSDETWVDVQWDIAEREWNPSGPRPFGPRANNLWERAVPLRIDGYQLQAPSPADMLLHLCLHLEGHEYCELVLFSDIVEFVAHYGERFDWSALIEVTREARAESSVAHVLDLTRRLFDIALPEDVFPALSPSYFEAQLYGPLYGNLTSLHQTLDDINAEVKPERDVMAELERLTRAQADQAELIHREVDSVAKSLVEAGADVVVFRGSSPLRVFPDRSVRPFEPIDMFILDDDADGLRRILDDRGFEVSPNGSARRVYSEANVEIEVSFASDLATALVADDGLRPSNRELALRSIRASGRSAARDTTTRVCVVVHALTPDALAVALITTFGRRADLPTALFQAMSCVDLPPELTNKLNASAMRRLADEHHVESDFQRGLAALESLLDAGSWAAAASECIVDPKAAPHVLEWARYGPTDLEGSPELRPAFLWILAFMATPGAGRKVRYALSSLLPGKSHPQLIRIASRAARAQLRPRQVKRARELCYWVEPA